MHYLLDSDFFCLGDKGAIYYGKLFYIECNNSEGVFSDNYFDLLAGDTVTIFFTPIEVNNDLNYDFSFKSAFEIIKR